MGFFALYDRIVPGNGKYMATLFNTSSTRKVVVNRIYRFNWQQSAVTGIILEQELRGITARTAGTSVTIGADDSNVALTGGGVITADHNSTVVTEGGKGLIHRFFASSEEVVLATTSSVITGSAAMLHDGEIIYWRKAGANSKGLVLRQNQGITIKNITNSTTGSVSYLIEFDDEPA